MKLITCASVILACSALVAACSNEQSDPQPSAPNAPASSSVGSPSPSPAEGSGARPERSIAVVHGSGSVDKWVVQTTPNGQRVIALDRAKKELGTWLLTRSPDGTPRLTSVGREVDPKLIAGFAFDATANRRSVMPSMPTTTMDEDTGDSGENSPGCLQATLAALIACIGVETGIGTAACISALLAKQIACSPPPSCNPSSCTGPCIDAGYMMGGQCITPTGSCTCAGNYCRADDCDTNCRMSGHKSGTCYTSGCTCSGDDDGSSGGSDPGSGSGSDPGSGPGSSSGNSDGGGCDPGSFPVSCDGEDAGCATSIEEAWDMCP